MTTEYLYPLEKPMSSELAAFKRAAHRAICNTTGFSIDDIEDDPQQRIVQYTLIFPEPTGWVEGFYAMSYHALQDTAESRIWQAVEEAFLAAKRENDKPTQTAFKRAT